MGLDRNLHFDFGDGTARHYRPQADGEEQGSQLESDIVNEDPLEDAAMDKGRHRQSSLPGRSPASCLRERRELGGSSSIKLSSTGLGSDGAGAYRRSRWLNRSRRRSTVNSRSMLPATAMLIVPVSSEMMTATASVSSVIPIAARWRVPSWVERTGFMESGRKQAAAAIRSRCTITAPSCKGALGRNTVASRSYDSLASSDTPLSI